jgi:hypothetical protein
VIFWYPYSAIQVSDGVNFDKFPNARTTSLLALEDLGRGSSGKCWLTTTLSKSSVCVLKFHNRDSTDKLKEEENKWHDIYGLTKVRVGIWSGSPALMLPHFSVIDIDERESFKEKIRYVLTFCFGNTWVHGDVRWRNIGKYRCLKTNEILPIVYDLQGAYRYEDDKHIDWVEHAMKSLCKPSN